MSNLDEQLKSQLVKSEAGRDKTHNNVIRDATAQLIKRGIEKNALGVGDKAPLFELPNANGKPVAIKHLLAQGPVVLNFYRGSWCAYCNLELRAYQQSLGDIESCGARLVAVSPELPDGSLTNAEKLALGFEVLSDVGNVAAAKFGLVYKMPDELISVYKQLGNEIPGHNGDDSWELPMPATYVIAPDGAIVFAHVTPDYLKRAEPQEVIDVLREHKNRVA